MAKYDKNIPTLRGYVVTRHCAINGPVKQIIVHCPACDATHAHGWPSGRTDSRYRTHRSPHCLNRTPFSEKGYYIAIERTRKP